MHGIIRTGNGKYYTSAIFGYYSDKEEEYDYEAYYIVFDESKSRLIKKFEYNPESRPHLDLQVLLVDGNRSQWVRCENSRYGGVDFLPKKTALELISMNELPDDILRKCREIDNNFHYSEMNVITNNDDIKRLMLVSRGFHDAGIKEIKELDEDSLYVRFDGTWECEIEMYFEGDVSYCIESRNPESDNLDWFCSSIMIQDGFIYFVDEDEMTVEDITDEYCWFKARRIRYHVIPD